ncbi:MAG TPA: hypothetical protein PKZ67_11615, partial [Accumulibacter sp.]|nr:hypothetical protein [Accumulibacter sp.]
MNAPYPRPQPDTTAILNALAALFQPDDVVELRSFAKGRKRTDAGYFDGEHRHELAARAIELNRTGAAVYVTLNPIDPQLLSRYANRIENGATTTTTDAQVTRRRWLLLDFDPARPSDTSATDAQLESAKAAAGECWQELQADGWPDPLAAESGNGFHLLYALDLPNDNESRDLIKGALAGLAARFDTDQVKLDQSVFNAGRITKLYGTLATKGDHTPLAPWRLSQLVATPERGAVVTADQLRAWIPATTAKPAAQAAGSQRGNGQAGGAFDLDGFLARMGIPFEQDQHEGSERFRLAHCPFNPEHGKGEAAIFRRAGGALGFKCQHNSCSSKGWADVRALVDGPREQRQGPAVDFSGLLKQGQRATPESALSADGRKLHGALSGGDSKEREVRQALGRACHRHGATTFAVGYRRGRRRGVVWRVGPADGRRFAGGVSEIGPQLQRNSTADGSICVRSGERAWVDGRADAGTLGRAVADPVGAAAREAV